MDPRKLLYFATIVELGSFKKAATRLKMSQPALSTSMDRFERSLGNRLLDRSPLGVNATPLGEALYSHARLIRDELESAELKMAGPGPRADNVIAFGTLPSLANGIVPTAICKWRAKHPAVTLRLTEQNQLGLLLRLLRGELDFIIAQTELYGFLDGMRQRVLFRDRLHVFCRSDHPVLDLAQPSWAQLARYPWVVQMVGRQRTVVDKLMAAAGVHLPEQLTECGSVDVIKSLVANSDNLAILPTCAINADVRAGRLATVEMTDPQLNRDIAVLFREGVNLTDTDRDLLAEIEAVGASMDDTVAPQPV